jgi:hypothetical protein
MSQPWHVPEDDLRSYAETRLAGPLLWSVEAHVIACAECRERLASVCDPALLDAGWARVDAALDAPRPGPIERLLLLAGVPDHVARLLTATPALRLSWLGAVALTLAVTAGLARAAAPVVFLAVAPLLPLLGVAVSFGPGVDPTYELTLTAPIQAFRLMLLRCVTVVAANAVLCGLASLSLPGLDWSAATWFLPSLALTVLTLLLAPRLGTLGAATVTGVGWAVLLAATAGAVFTGPGQLTVAGAVVGATALLARRSASFDTSRLFRRSFR